MPVDMSVQGFFAVRETDKIVKVYQVQGLECKSISTVTTSPDGTLSCNCIKFLFRKNEKKCEHMAVGGEFDYRIAESPCRITKAYSIGTLNIGDLVFIEGGLPDGKNIFKISDLPNCNAFELLTALRQTTTRLDGKSGTLNHHRIVTELKASEKIGRALIYEDVRAAGEAVKDDYLIEHVEPLEVDMEVDMEGSDWKATSGLDSELKTETCEATTLKFNTIAKPNADQFYVDDDVWQVVLHSIETGRATLFTGPSGCGKSELCYIAAKALDRHLEPFNMGAMSEPRLSLIGATHFDKSEGTWFSRSRFVKTVTTENGVVLLDELSRCEPGAFNILLPLMDRQGYLALDESEDAGIIERAKGVAFFATANVGMEYTGTEAMDKALRDRFSTVVDLFFPPAGAEQRLLKTRCKIDNVTANRLVDIAVRQRDMLRNDGDFTEYVSTRMLLEAGHKIRDGMNFKTALKFAVENQFSNEGGDSSERVKICQIVQKGIR